MPPEDTRVSNVELALALIQLANVAAPLIGNMIITIRNGQVSVATFLDEADAQFSKSIQQGNDWLREHPVKTGV
jgi:hypothetical protein